MILSSASFSLDFIFYPNLNRESRKEPQVIDFLISLFDGDGRLLPYPTDSKRMDTVTDTRMANPATDTAMVMPATGTPTATATVTPTAKSARRTATATDTRMATPMELFIPRMNRCH